MIDILAANADKTDHQGRPTAESLGAARAAGAFALGTPAAYAGAQATVTEAARTLTAMGRACPSTAWIAGTCLTAKTMAAVVAGFDKAALDDFFTDPDALMCGSGNPGGSGVRGPDGVRITGRWPNVSGCEDATWAGLGVMVDGVFCYAQIPVADLTIDRTWAMTGLRGTGSHTLVADDVPVPADQVTVFAAPPGVAAMQLFAITVLAPMVGATFAALDLVTAMFASDRTPFRTAYASMAESPGARQWLAEATALVRRAERSMLAVAAAADTGTGLTATDGSRLHFDLSDAARDCRAALEQLLDLYGMTGLRDSHPLQRLWRDVAVGSRHAHLNPYLAAEDYARTVSGAPA